MRFHFATDNSEGCCNKIGPYFNSSSAAAPASQVAIPAAGEADDSRKLGAFDNFTLLDFILIQAEKLKGENKEAAAEAIENNIRKKIVEKQLINPKYYEKLSAILLQLIEERRKGVHSYEELLNKYIQLVKQLEQPENNPEYPKSIRHRGALRAFYDNFGNDEEFALTIDKAIRESKEADFRYNKQKERKIKNALYAVVNELRDRKSVV